jgi:hypothetical protein
VWRTHALEMGIYGWPSLTMVEEEVGYIPTSGEYMISTTYKKKIREKKNYLVWSKNNGNGCLIN